MWAKEYVIPSATHPFPSCCPPPLLADPRCCLSSGFTPAFWCSDGNLCVLGTTCSPTIFFLTPLISRRCFSLHFSELFSHWSCPPPLWMRPRTYPSGTGVLAHLALLEASSAFHCVCFLCSRFSTPCPAWAYPTPVLTWSTPPRTLHCYSESLCSSHTSLGSW